MTASPAAAGPAVNSARAEHPHLRLCRDDHETAIAVAIEGLDAKIDGGLMHEWADPTGRAPTLLRYTGFDGVQSSVAVPPGRLTPHIRALVWELAEAIEDAGRKLGPALVVWSAIL